MNSTATVHNVIIVGSGPAGYTAAIYLARAGLKPVVVAGALTPGGQLINTTEVENYPGFPDGVMGPDLMESMQRQAERFGAEIVFDDVESADLQGELKSVHLSGGQDLQTRTVIVATGSNYRHLNVPGELEYSGKGVSYCATCDGFFFRGKPIVVVGGGDSAMEEANFLARFGSSVTLIHRRDDHGYIRIDETSTGATRTSVPGVFAAGDCADAIYQQAIVAAGSGCRAALDVQSYLEDIPEGI